MPDVCFSNQNSNLGKIFRALDWKMLIYFMAILNILRTCGIDSLWLFGTFCVHSVHFLRFGYHAPRKIWQPCTGGNPIFRSWKVPADVNEPSHAKTCCKSCSDTRVGQGCQMVYFHTKNSSLGIFKKALEWKMSLYFWTIWNILMSFSIFYSH
jgi:hypothetical protein